MPEELFVVKTWVWFGWVEPVRVVLMADGLCGDSHTFILHAFVGFYHGASFLRTRTYSSSACFLWPLEHPSETIAAVGDTFVASAIIPSRHVSPTAHPPNRRHCPSPPGDIPSPLTPVPSSW